MFNIIVPMLSLTGVVFAIPYRNAFSEAIHGVTSADEWINTTSVEPLSSYLVAMTIVETSFLVQPIYGLSTIHGGRIHTVYESAPTAATSTVASRPGQVVTVYETASAAPSTTSQNVATVYQTASPAPSDAIQSTTSGRMITVYETASATPTSSQTTKTEVCSFVDDGKTSVVAFEFTTATLHTVYCAGIPVETAAVVAGIVQAILTDDMLVTTGVLLEQFLYRPGTDFVDLGADVPRIINNPFESEPMRPPPGIPQEGTRPAPVDPPTPPNTPEMQMPPTPPNAPDMQMPQTGDKPPTPPQSPHEGAPQEPVNPGPVNNPNIPDYGGHPDPYTVPPSRPETPVEAPVDEHPSSPESPSRPETPVEAPVDEHPSSPKSPSRPDSPAKPPSEQNPSPPEGGNDNSPDAEKEAKKKAQQDREEQEQAQKKEKLEQKKKAAEEKRRMEEAQREAKAEQRRKDREAKKELEDKRRQEELERLVREQAQREEAERQRKEQTHEPESESQPQEPTPESRLPKIQQMASNWPHGPQNANDNNPYRPLREQLKKSPIKSVTQLKQFSQLGEQEQFWSEMDNLFNEMEDLRTKADFATQKGNHELTKVIRQALQDKINKMKELDRKIENNNKKYFKTDGQVPSSQQLGSPDGSPSSPQQTAAPDTDSSNNGGNDNGNGNGNGVNVGTHDSTRQSSTSSTIQPSTFATILTASPKSPATPTPRPFTRKEARCYDFDTHQDDMVLFQIWNINGWNGYNDDRKTMQDLDHALQFHLGRSLWHMWVGVDSMTGRPFVLIQVHHVPKGGKIERAIADAGGPKLSCAQGGQITIKDLVNNAAGPWVAVNPRDKGQFNLGPVCVGTNGLGAGC